MHACLKKVYTRITEIAKSSEINKGNYESMNTRITGIAKSSEINKGNYESMN